MQPNLQKIQETETIEPTFLKLTPDNIIKDISKEISAFQGFESTDNLFPVEVFPEAVQDIIKDTNTCLGYPVDFMGASILYAASVSIGNAYSVEVKRGWRESAILYISIVGRAGTNKSHPISFALQPIEKIDGIKFQEYIRKKREFDLISALPKKERDSQGYDDPIKPIWEQYLVSDFTPEALTEVHKFNKRGIGVYVDELATWFKNFNRYSKGSEEQFWLTAWSGKQIRINRKTTEPTLIPKPFVSVIGAIQPKVLNELAANRTENGFLDRVLFVAPKDLNKSYWSEEELQPLTISNWENIVSSLLGFSLDRDQEGNPQPMVLKLTPEAKKYLSDWQKKLTDESNDSEDEALGGINAKLEVYAIRFSLILQMIAYVCNEGSKDAVNVEAAKGAVRLAEYFKKTAVAVRSILKGTPPVGNLAEDKQHLYNVLPNEFTTNEGEKIAEGLNIPSRTFRHFISNKELFVNEKRGKYKKMY